ncbi:hypothetical protein [Thermus albus]|uniref:hypothetical protein n=1 Tax=Thermus albus TaxID=2908146 RepID=UPI001FA950D1|nr:hypothetical protein [Thermus albus]
MKVKVRNTWSVYVRELYRTLYAGQEYEVPEEIYRRYEDWLEPAEGQKEKEKQKEKKN